MLLLIWNQNIEEVEVSECVFLASICRQSLVYRVSRYGQRHTHTFKMIILYKTHFERHTHIHTCTLYAEPLVVTALHREVSLRDCVRACKFIYFKVQASEEQIRILEASNNSLIYLPLHFNVGKKGNRMALKRNAILGLDGALCCVVLCESKRLAWKWTLSLFFSF